ncbi:hypothetical protein D6855_12315 [Butyrivibrio sp. CB08]|nr:hypothetical protein D6855_12315 [Butyrivibrio sp. CB08]
MAILTIISAFILVLMIVYATNAKKINELFGWGKAKETVSEELSEELSEEVFTGDQIGDDLSGFMLDEDFFDETEKIPSVVVRKKTSAGASSGADATSGAAGASGEALIGDDGIKGDDEDAGDGTGMAVVGQITNPNPEYPSMYQDDVTGASGYLTSVPQAPAGGFGQYIPADQTVTGTPVGTP